MIRRAGIKVLFFAHPAVSAVSSRGSAPGKSCAAAKTASAARWKSSAKSPAGRRSEDPDDF